MKQILGNDDEDVPIDVNKFNCSLKKMMTKQSSKKLKQEKIEHCDPIKNNFNV
jgi:hypothetical protein